MARHCEAIAPLDSVPMANAAAPLGGLERRIFAPVDRRDLDRKECLERELCCRGGWVLLGGDQLGPFRHRELAFIRASSANENASLTSGGVWAMCVLSSESSF